MASLCIAFVASWFWKFVGRFGAYVFFPLGLLDMSVLPAPGSFDLLLVVHTASHKQLWWYYALMATGGSVVGAWPSYKLGRKGGEEAIEKRLGARRTKKVFSTFRRWGFWSIFAGAIAPPPMPSSALVLASGALNYPLRNFLVSWTLGRLARFALVGWVTAHYGRHIFMWMRNYYKPALWTLIVAGVVGGAAAAVWYTRNRQRAAMERAAETHRPENRAA